MKVEVHSYHSIPYNASFPVMMKYGKLQVLRFFLSINLRDYEASDHSESPAPSLT
jgi:hypothetical protein